VAACGAQAPTSPVERLAEGADSSDVDKVLGVDAVGGGPGQKRLGRRIGRNHRSSHDQLTSATILG
jgi:hypothetical protein